MKNTPNIPATLRACTRLAPETVRERDIRSGISGLWPRASRTTKPTSRATATAPAQGLTRPPAESAGSTIV